MNVSSKEYAFRGMNFIIRSATEKDAKKLSAVRLQIDGETENLDREQGEAYMDESGFIQLIKEDSERKNNIFLVAEVNGNIAGFCRCEGNMLKRTSHKVEFGVAVLKDYWGYGIGKSLLMESINWADSIGLKKMALSVLEINEKAITLYKQFGFEVEGILRKDKVLSDGNYYDTLLMARFRTD